jgi:hypothetical protein
MGRLRGEESGILSEFGGVVAGGSLARRLDIRVGICLLAHEAGVEMSLDAARKSVRHRRALPRCRPSGKPMNWTASKKSVARALVLAVSTLMSRLCLLAHEEGVEMSLDAARRSACATGLRIYCTAKARMLGPAAMAMYCLLSKP